MITQMCKSFSLGVLLLSFGCAMAGPNSRQSNELSSEFQVETLFPQNPTAGLPDQLIRNGIKAFYEKDYTTASAQFNHALKYDPRNSYLQFLNGLTYHLLAEGGDAGKYDFARLGYELALKFDNSNHLAAQQLAYYYLKSRNYKKSQEYFSYSLLYQPDNAELLYGLAKSSYYSGDIETALGAIRRAKENRPNNPEIISGNALISAATGDFNSAAVNLAEFRTIEPASPRIYRSEQRIRDWEELYRFHRDKPLIIAAADTSQPPETDPWANINIETKTETKAETKAETRDVPATTSSDPKMVVIDVTMIRTEENESTNRGINLLDGLKFQFSGEASYNLNPAGSPSGNTIVRSLTGKIGAAAIDYNLNIFNSGTDRSEVLARPTIIALDGKESKFFAGTVLNVAILGAQQGSLEKIETGVTLQVTPVFQPDGSILLTLMVNRAFIDVEAAGGSSFKESVKTSKNEITANVIIKFGQTLVLSGLREKETSEGKSGVPLLMDIPIVQYLFSNKTTQDFHRSILIILTPRRVLPGVNLYDDAEPPENEMKSLKEFQEKNPFIFMSNVGSVMRQVEKHKIVKELRGSDIYDYIWWGNFDSLNTMVKRAVSFLYY